VAVGVVPDAQSCAPDPDMSRGTLVTVAGRGGRVIGMLTWRQAPQKSISEIVFP
jgi:hypothetical protein